MNEVTNDKSLSDFREYLKQELLRRCNRNPRYSLRAFAKSISLSHATLSHILAGRRPLTPKSIEKIGSALGLTPKHLEKFVVARGKRSYSSHNELTLDTFTVISEWYHDAIAELTHLESFQPNPRWIAKVLGITVAEVNMAVERLIRLELLEVSGDKWIDLSRKNTTSLDPNFTSLALKKYQKKVLEFSSRSIDEVPKTHREHVSNMVCFQKGDLAEVKKRISEFRFKLTTYLERRAAKPEEVYQLAISFFPISKVNFSKG